MKSAGLGIVSNRLIGDGGATKRAKGLQAWCGVLSPFGRKDTIACFGQSGDDAGGQGVAIRWIAERDAVLVPGKSRGHRKKMPQRNMVFFGSAQIVVLGKEREDRCVEIS